VLPTIAVATEKLHVVAFTVIEDNPELLQPVNGSE
jgi:hypothetical protein